MRKATPRREEIAIKAWERGANGSLTARMAGEKALGALQTTVRWRSIQVSSTSAPSRCHQFVALKISTSL